ncbi:hypothetical protein BBJ28_00014590 [Nothophytophthora sp. Chile5]|nr:hypothetical protein BBJ28_00014590 [Nothophytophthora sp. Chile5]
MAAKRKRHDEELLAQCVERVLGGESATAVSKQAQIPYTTLLGRVNWKKRGYQPAVVRRRQQLQLAGDEAPAAEGDAVAPTIAPMGPTTRSPAPKLPEVDEQRVLESMARMQRAGICVRRRDVLRRANELLAPASGETEGADDTAGECGTQWFIRFRERHPEVSGHGTNLMLASEATDRVLAAYDASSDHLDGAATAGGNGNASADAERADEEIDADEEAEDDDDTSLTPSQRAVQVLQTRYASQLDAADMVEAFDVMADSVLAGVFLVLAPGELRDLWLRQRIRKSRVASGNDVSSTTASEVV